MNFNCSLSLSHSDIKSAQLLHDSRLHHQGRVSAPGWGELVDCVFISCIHTNYKHTAISGYIMESPQPSYRPADKENAVKIRSKQVTGYKEAIRNLQLVP